MPKVSVSRDEIAGESLPTVCLVCGEDASHFLYPNVGAPSLAWIFFSPLFGILALWSHILLGKQPTTGGLPFCDRHQSYWKRRALYIVMGFVAMVAFFFIAVVLSTPDVPGKKSEPHWFLGVFGCWMIIYLPSFMLVHLASMRPIGGNRKSLVLAGVNRKFVDALKEDEEDEEFEE